MRIVLDSNVLVAAFATRGLCHELLEIVSKDHEIFISLEILGEVEGRLRDKLRVPVRAVAAAKEALETCVVESPVPVPRDVCRDPKDLHVLGLAAAAKADILVTGDEDLLVVRHYHLTEIVSPRRLYDRLRASGPGHSAVAERGRAWRTAPRRARSLAPPLIARRL